MNGWPTVDVAAVLDAMTDKATQELNWRSCTMTATHPTPPRWMLGSTTQSWGSSPRMAGSC